mmetsp:Transcript_36070/g.103786  ORF Transcript_36070/g.103786 Transcript_36070/m.103786 type:complete len:420 (+) Transcript_36070:69-1328(+)
MAPDAAHANGHQALTQICRLVGHEERVWCVAWRPGANPPLLASCGSDRTIRLWGPRNGNLEEPWVPRGVIDATDRHTRTLRTLAWDPSGEILAVCSFDATTSLWTEAKEGDEEAAEGEGGMRFAFKGLVSGHENEVKCVAFSPSGEYLATCSRDKSVWIFETDRNFEYECVSVLQSHTQDVKALKWHPTQDVLFSCSYDDTVKVWGPDGDDWSCKETFEVHESTVWSMAFDPVGARFATCSDDRTVRIWAPGSAPAAAPGAKLPNGTKAAVPVAAAAYILPLFRHASLPVPPPPEPKVEEPPASQAPPTAPADAACSWTTVSTIRDKHPRPVYSVDWLKPPEGSSFGDTLATGGGDNRVRVLQPATRGREWACVAELEAHSGDVNCVAWCPQALPGSGGVLVASAGDDAEVAILRFGHS